MPGESAFFLGGAARTLRRRMEKRLCRPRPQQVRPRLSGVMRTEGYRRQRPSISTTGKTFPSAAEARTADGNKLAEQQRGSIGTVTQTGREDPVAETILTVADFSPNRINGVYDNKLCI